MTALIQGKTNTLNHDCDKKQELNRNKVSTDEILVYGSKYELLANEFGWALIKKVLLEVTA